MSTVCNNVQLIGNLGKDPEIKQFEAGKKMAKVSLATTEFYKNDKGEKVSDTQWHNLIAWGKTAEVMERFLKKGAEVAVLGKLVTRNYLDKDGIKRYTTEVHISELQMLSGPKQAAK
jgi:single-strand DNA-binding protein